LVSNIDGRNFDLVQQALRLSEPSDAELRRCSIRH